MRKLWRRFLLALVCVGGGILSLSFLHSAGSYVDRYWMDTVTGSTREIREWKWWGRGEEKITLSSLEKWIIDNDGGYLNNWDYVSGLHTSLIPLGKTYGNGGSPPIYSLGTTTEPLDAFVANAEPKEIKEFVETMRNGNEEAQEAAVDAIFDKGLELWEEHSR